ncbi:MAG: porin [Gammaproteobacteria bacterium]
MPSKTRHIFAAAAAVSLAGILGMPSAAQAAWQISDEDSSIKFGFLAQMRAESVDAGSAGDSNDLFFRRLRLLAGGKLNDNWSFFFETDSPNIGKGSGSGKGTSDVYIQDFVVTYKPGGDSFMLDFGMLLNALTYNSNQSAVSLMTTDYAPVSFVWSGPLDARVGRDYGVRARGYLLGDRLEYRASILGGNRDTRDADYRFMGRLAFNVFTAQKGLFYSGTTLGKSQILVFGASYDTQEDYEAYSVDAHWDQPIGSGSITVSGAWSHLDGDDFLTSLPEQDNIWFEAGWYFGGLKLMPFFQYTERDFDSESLADAETMQFGLGYMFRGHNGNVKFSWATTDVDGADDIDTFWINLQAFKF